jgi:hypothetical protein
VYSHTRITNLVEGKHYYGVRSSKVSPFDDIGSKYYGSPCRNAWLKQDQKDNPSNYKYKILRCFSTRKEAYARESNVHHKFDVVRNQDKFYNGCNSSVNGFKCDNIGTVNVIINGKRKKITTQEFSSGKYKHINKDMVDVFDPTLERRTKVSKTDPRFISGEVYIQTSELTKLKSSEAIIGYNKSIIGGRWLISPCGRKSKNFPPYKIESMLMAGWKFGRILREDRIISKPSLGKKWFTNATEEILCLPGSEPLGFIPGKIKRAWITKGEETIQIPL